MSLLAVDVCCDMLRPGGRYASEGLKQDLRDEVEFRQARLTAQGNKLRSSIDMYSRDAMSCLRDGNEPLARQLVSQKVAMQNRLAYISTHWGVLESIRASLLPGARRCIEDVETCRLIMTKAQCSVDVAIRRPGEEDVDGVDDADVDLQMIKLREMASKEPRMALVGRAVYLHENEPSKNNMLVDLHGGSDGGSVGDASSSSDEQLLCTGEGEGSALSTSSRSGSPPGSPPRPLSPTMDGLVKHD